MAGVYLLLQSCIVVDGHISGIPLQVNQTDWCMCKIKSQLHGIPIFIRFTKPHLVDLQSFLVVLIFFKEQFVRSCFSIHWSPIFIKLKKRLRAEYEPARKKFFQICSVLICMDLMNPPNIFNHLTWVALWPCFGRVSYIFLSEFSQQQELFIFQKQRHIELLRNVEFLTNVALDFLGKLDIVDNWYELLHLVPDCWVQSWVDALWNAYGLTWSSAQLFHACILMPL